jgi:nucleolar MIF4G domain-containing protein 1
VRFLFYSSAEVSLNAKNPAAFFVQRVVSAYEQHYTDLTDAAKNPEQAAVPDNPQTDASTSGKECSNLIVLLSELYNFQVISCVLVFDIIRGLLDTDLSEFSVELLLKVVRSTRLPCYFFCIRAD